MSSNLANAFRSPRLLYRAIEDTEEEKSWFHTAIQNDPLNFALSDSNVLRPQTRPRNDAKLLSIRDSLLGVLICLAEQPETRIGVLSLDDEAAENYRHHHRLASLSIAVAREWQGKGFGGEAISWAMEWAFERANIHSLSLWCVEFNERANYLYGKLGFVLEGRFRKCHWHERRRWDVLLFSMLEEEWVEKRRKEKVGEL